MSNKTKWKWIAQSSDGSVCKYENHPQIDIKGMYVPNAGNFYQLQASMYVKESIDWHCINLDEYDYKIVDGILIKIDKLIGIYDLCKAFSVPFPEHMTIADKAKKIVFGDREQTYGNPGKNLRMIAGMWSAYLGIEITPEQVCDMMVQLKIARLKSSPDHEDSKVDIIGYTLLKERLKENEKKL